MTDTHVDGWLARLYTAIAREKIATGLPLHLAAHEVADLREFSLAMARIDEDKEAELALMQELNWLDDFITRHSPTGD